MSKSTAEEKLALEIRAAGLPEPDREYRFHPTRRWRADFAWADLKLLVEVEGGTYSGGRHTRGVGFAKDCEKYNAATLLGWKVLRYPTEAVNDGTAITQIRKVFEQ